MIRLILFLTFFRHSDDIRSQQVKNWSIEIKSFDLISNWFLPNCYSKFCLSINSDDRRRSIINVDEKNATDKITINLACNGAKNRSIFRIMHESTKRSEESWLFFHRTGINNLARWLTEVARDERRAQRNPATRKSNCRSMNILPDFSLY